MKDVVVASLIVCLAVQSLLGQVMTKAAIEIAMVEVRDGMPVGINLQFGVTSARPVAEVKLFYKLEGDKSFHSTKLKLTPESRYATTIKWSETVRYFVTIKTERGPSVDLGSVTDPGYLDARTLPNESTASDHHLLYWLLGIIAAAVTPAIIKAK